MSDDALVRPEDLVFERQRRIRFEDLDEFFFARLLLGLVDDPTEDRTVTVDCNLNTLFTRYESPEAAEAAANVECDIPNRLGELFVGALQALLPPALQTRAERVPARDHYVKLLRLRLGYLKSGDTVALPPTIDAVSEPSPGRFSVTFRTGTVRRCLHENLGKRLSVRGDFAAKTQHFLPDAGVRIDYRKELDLLQLFLATRQSITGAPEFSFTTAEVPFRQAISVFSDGGAMPAATTSGPEDKALLPIYLEICGLIDITYIGLCSPPEDPLRVVVKYSVRRPVARNIFSVASQGLSPVERRNLSEIELSIYDRVHHHLQKRYVFLSRPSLERSFGTICAWMIRKVAYTLEAPSFLTKPAFAWTESNAGHEIQRMEDDFFLPFMHERLYEAFGDRIRKKPKMSGGEVDLLFDDLPIELKVRRDRAIPLSQCVHEAYRPASQAAAYATKTRLGIVAVLDLPADEPTISNLDSCVSLLQRNVGSDLPTCVVVFIFHCHSVIPSLLR